VAGILFITGNLLIKVVKATALFFVQQLQLRQVRTDSGAYYFDGTSSYMKVKNSPSLNPTQL
jgi:hypothetical protein